MVLLLFLAGCGSETAVNEADGSAELSAPSGGGLLFMQTTPGQQSLVRYDLETEAIETLFATENNAWLSYADSAPDGSQFVLSYSPSPPDGGVQFGFTQLYLLVNGENEPRLLIEPTKPDDIYFYPNWANNGRFITYSHVVQGENGRDFTTTLERYELDTGEITILAENGIWARLSPDSRKIAYVFVEPNSLIRRLVVADANGGNELVVVDENDFVDIDAPFFTPDNEWLYFSAVEHAQTSFWEQLMGVPVASAHNVPSDWWRVPISGGELERITSISETGIAGTVLPNKQEIAFVSQTGLFTMGLDGSDLEKQLETMAGGFAVWIP
ncbi:MAG: hypothetical protein AAF614_20685 [Chloroflexota bacterium]